MTVLSFLLVVVASLLHATWNLLAKRAAAAGPSFVFAYSLFSFLFFTPWALYLLLGTSMALSLKGMGFILLSGAIHLAYNLLLQRGYQVAPLSVVYPVARGTGPMLSTLGAFVIMHEIPTLEGVLGVVLIIMGILLIATQGNISAFRRPEGRTGVRWGVSTGGMIAAYTVVDAIAVKTLGVAPVVLNWFTNTLNCLLLLPVIMRNPRRAMDSMRGHWWVAMAVGILSPLSYILVLMALRAGAPLSLVAPMREMSMMVGALMGMLILKEPVGIWRLVGCGVLVAGVIAIAVS